MSATSTYGIVLPSSRDVPMLHNKTMHAPSRWVCSVRLHVFQCDRTDNACSVQMCEGSGEEV